MNLKKLLVLFLVMVTASVKAEVVNVTSVNEAKYARFIQAIGAHESANWTVTLADKGLDKKAYGYLGIRQDCVTDVNRVYGTNITVEQCQYDYELSVWVFKAYMSIYATPERIGRKVTWEDSARIWNGGPNGWRYKSTEKYWAKIQIELKKLEPVPGLAELAYN